MPSGVDFVSEKNNGKRRKRYDNTGLMRAMGSTDGRFDPEPPDQYLWIMNHSTNPRDRVVAWVQSKTIAINHRMPFAVDEHGRALYIQHVATDFEWAMKTAQNVIYEAHQEGRIRLDSKNKRIYLCAEVSPQEADKEWGIDGEDFARVQSQFPPYVADFIENLPAERRATAVKRYEQFWMWQKAGMADAVAAWRSVSQPIEDSILRELGFEKERLPQRRPQPKLVKLQVVDLPGFVDFVQGQDLPVQTNGNGLHKAESGSVQGHASLLSRDTDTDTDNNARQATRGDAPESSASLKKDSVQRAGGRSQEQPAHPPQTSISPELTAGLEQRGYGYLLADDGAIRSLVSDLADTPLDLYWGILDERLQRARGSKQTLGLPILRDKARQARKTWERQTAAKSAQREEATQPHSREAIREALLTLADPHADPDLKTLAQEMIDQDRAAQPTARAAGGVS